MELTNLFFTSIKMPPIFSPKSLKQSISLSHSPESESLRLTLSERLQCETLKTLEWSSICKQLAKFASTPMGCEIARNAKIPFGKTREESEKLLEQTEAAVRITSEKLDFSGIQDVSGIVSSAVSGDLLTVTELCAVRRTLKAARELFDKLKGLAAGGDCAERYLPLLEISPSSNILMGLEQKIDFCLDCNFSKIHDRASENLELIRSERKRNMEKLDSLLKTISFQIFQSARIDRPLITKRRGRMCVSIRASHKYLLPNGIVLNVSSSGATYFMEPSEAVELNNMEVRLSNSEKAEEIAILSSLSTEIAESEMSIRYLLDRILELDLAFARAAYAKWVNGVCPCFVSTNGSEGLNTGATGSSLVVDIDSIQNPLLLGSYLQSFSDSLSSSSVNAVHFEKRNRAVNSGGFPEDEYDFPVPIDIKIGFQTRVVVISGPNTGGKTASIKTLGLASVMANAGMYLPARNHPKLPWFDLVLAAIGDHQSLEQNLSTFSGHISWIHDILKVTTKESLVLIDEIVSGTDPSEGLALSASILQYIKDRVNLAVVTTHYADLTRLKEEDTVFENAAVEFSLESLRPTYRILWGSTGDSNALNIAKSIGFNPNVIERAEQWMESLKPESKDKRRNLLYQSLLDERSRLEAQRRRAAFLHAEILNLYTEIHKEAEDLDGRETTLKAHETQRVQQEIKATRSKMETVIEEFESQLRTASIDQFNALIRKSESAIASIVEAHRPAEGSSNVEANTNSYTPEIGEQVCLLGLGNKLAIVVDAAENEETVLVQYGKIKVRVKKSNIKALPSRERNTAVKAAPHLKRQGQKSREFVKSTSMDGIKDTENSYGPLVQTSKNTVDLRGMRVEEASYHLNMAISARDSNSVIFVIHGMGTGAIKERALDILRNHPRVAKYEQESPMNYGCTVAYIK